MAYAAEEAMENTLIAVVNGEETVFEQVSSEIQSDGEMIISYEAYSPRGTLMHQLELIMDEQISTGSYSSSDDNGIGIWVEDHDYLSRGPKYVGSKIVLGSHGYFEFKLTERSADWSEYRGTFYAVATGVDGATGEITIEDARFHFTVPFTGASSAGSFRYSGSSTGNSYSSGNSSYSSGYDWEGNSSTTCFNCSGSGKCDDCGGTGNRVSQKDSINLGSGSKKYTVTESCYTCMGSGKCIWCKGNGTSGN